MAFGLPLKAGVQERQAAIKAGTLLADLDAQDASHNAREALEDALKSSNALQPAPARQTLLTDHAPSRLSSAPATKAHAQPKAQPVPIDVDPGSDADGEFELEEPDDVEDEEHDDVRRDLFPAEIKLQILSYIPEDHDALTHYRLMCTSKSWARLIDTEANWQRRAKAMGAQRRGNGCDWKATWVKWYGGTCRRCGRGTSAKFNLLDDDPTWISVCLGCQRGPYACVGEHTAKSTYGLTNAELSGLPSKWHHDGYSRYGSSYHKECLLSSVKKIRDAKLMRKVDRIKTAYQGDQTRVVCAFEAGFKRSLSTALSEDATAFINATSPPTHQQLEAFVAFHQGLLSLPDTLGSKLTDEDLSDKVTLAMQLLDTGGNAQQTWRTKLARGQATLPAFIQAVRDEVNRQAEERRKQEERNLQRAKEQRERDRLWAERQAEEVERQHLSAQAIAAIKASTSAPTTTFGRPLPTDEQARDLFSIRKNAIKCVCGNTPSPSCAYLMCRPFCLHKGCTYHGGPALAPVAPS